MKIAFDEHIPPALVRVFQGLAREGMIDGIEFFSAADFAARGWTIDSKRRSDVPWLRAFALAGGKVIITGDKRMRQVTTRTRGTERVRRLHVSSTLEPPQRLGEDGSPFALVASNSRAGPQLTGGNDMGDSASLERNGLD